MIKNTLFTTLSTLAALYVLAHLWLLIPLVWLTIGTYFVLLIIRADPTNAPKEFVEYLLAAVFALIWPITFIIIVSDDDDPRDVFFSDLKKFFVNKYFQLRSPITFNNAPTQEEQE